VDHEDTRRVNALAAGGASIPEGGEDES
jgi:hypothetical protein